MRDGEWRWVRVTGPLLLALTVGALGLAIGSFLNVVVARVPAGASVVSPPSACPRCGHGIRSRDNVPVLSWLLLRGRCRDCRTPISVRYPVIEALTCTLFLGVALVFRPDAGSAATLVASGIELVAFLYLMAVSVALSAIDLDTHTLPNRIVLPMYPVLVVLLSAAAIITGDPVALLRGAIGMAGLGLLYLVLAIAVPGGMGFGDVKLAGALGFVLAYLGWGPLAVGSFGAFVLGGSFALVLLLVRPGRRTRGIPFGPWMLAGTWLGIVLGEPLWSGYLGLLGLS